MRIVNGLDKDKRYGAILNKEGANDGECGEPLIKLFPGSTCFNLDIYYDLDGNPFKDPQYVNILKVNPDFDDSGTNVFFDSDHLFARLSQDITQTDFPYIDNIFLAKYHFGTTIKNRSPDRIIRQQYKKIGHWYTDAAPRENECCVEVGVDDDGNDLPDCGDKGTCGCTDVDPEGTCLKNIEVQGSYYIVFYSHNEKGRANRFCQILTGDQGNIGVSTDLLGGERKLYDFAVIPKY